MGVLRSLITGRPDPLVDAVTPGPQTAFSAADELIGGADIDPAVFGLESYARSTSPAPRIDRRSAIQVPAVKRCRDLIAGVLGGLPLDLYNADRSQVAPSPFAQPERNVPRSVTMARTFEDMLFEGIAWWLITEQDWRGFPTYYKRLKPGRVVVNEDLDKVYVDGRETDQSKLVCFYSPTDGLLTAGARAIRTCLQLDAAAAVASDGRPPVQYFVPADGGDLEDEEIVAALDAWADTTRRRVAGYVPSALKLMDAGWDPEKLQMIEQRQHAVLEIARIAGVDAEDLGVSTTSRTYENGLTRRQWFIDMTLGPYRQAVEDRLSMGDVTPRGQYVKFNLDSFLRSDPKTRYEAYQLGLQVGALDEPEIRELEDKPQLAGPASAPAPLRALPTRSEETA